MWKIHCVEALRLINWGVVATALCRHVDNKSPSASKQRGGYKLAPSLVFRVPIVIPGVKSQ